VVAVHIADTAMTMHVTSSVAPLCSGALLATFVSLVMLVSQTVMMRR